MGNKDSKRISSFADWEKVQNLNGIELFRNKHNNQYAQKRTVSIDPHFDLKDELKIYQLRQFNNDSLVRSFGALQIQNKGGSNGICSGHKKLEVLTERIPYRFSDLPQLTFAESLLFLRQSLRAYSKIFRSYGPIHITKKMIGINDYGEVRCWLNQSWALNHPDHQFPTLQSSKMDGIPQTKNGEHFQRCQVFDGRYRDETEMVHNIVCLIEEKCEQGKFPSAFSEQIGLYSTSFRKLSLYLQDFLSINQFFVPPKIDYEKVLVSKSKIIANNQGFNKSEGVTDNRNISQSLNAYNQGGQIYQNKGDLNSNFGAFGAATVSTNLEGDRYNFFHNYSKSPEPIFVDNSIIKTTVNTFADSQGQIQKQFVSNYLPQQNLPLLKTTQNYQSSSYDTGKPFLSSKLGFNKQLRPLSIQKPLQNQSNYSSSYYQYSNTNPSPLGSYNHVEILTNTDLLSRKQQTKPYSYTNLTNFLGSGSNQNTNANSSTYQLKNQIVNSGDFIKDYKNLYSVQQNSSSYQSAQTNLKNLGTYQGLKNFYPIQQKVIEPQKQPYNLYQNFNKFEPSYPQNAYKNITYSFDVNQDYHSKFNDSISKATQPEKYFNQFNSTIGKSFLKDTFNHSTASQQFNYGNKYAFQTFRPLDSNTQKSPNIFQGLIKVAQTSQNKNIFPIPV